MPPVEDVVRSRQTLFPPAAPVVEAVGAVGDCAVPLQFTVVPPGLPAIPFPAVTVPRVSDSFADVVANTATLESPGFTPSSDVNPTSSNATPLVIGPVTVSAVAGAAVPSGVATTVAVAPPLPTYFHPLAQSRPPYTVSPSADDVSDTVSPYVPRHTYTRFLPVRAFVIPAPTVSSGDAMVPRPAAVPSGAGATKTPVAFDTTHGSAEGSSVSERQSAPHAWYVGLHVIPQGPPSPPASTGRPPPSRLHTA